MQIYRWFRISHGRERLKHRNLVVITVLAVALLFAIAFASQSQNNNREIADLEYALVEPPDFPRLGHPQILEGLVALEEEALVEFLDALE